MALSHCCCRTSVPCYSEMIVDCLIYVHYTKENDCKNRKVLRSRQNETTDEATRTRGSREFQARAAATGKAWLLIVVRHVDKTSRTYVSVEQSCFPEGRKDAFAQVYISKAATWLQYHFKTFTEIRKLRDLDGAPKLTFWKIPSQWWGTRRQQTARSAKVFERLRHRPSNECHADQNIPTGSEHSRSPLQKTCHKT